ncbi:MAG: MotA/TolQ/ExbB proton channel family protein [Lachnospiraceae bacterium]|nr:MotA/TolQ/ExbB proton channel family protein [Lachnospiraceae bacterium]
MLCLYLNLFSSGQTGDITNLVVNIAMFVIVGIILFSSVTGSLHPVSKLAADLRKATEKIENDAKHSHRYLWEKYRDEKEELFEDFILRRQYQDYQYELDRLVLNDTTYYKCDIEDYIGYDLVDSVIHRDRLNQVAGVMTGMGILGTFIGLSLGLQSFNTGTTAEITDSIEPLMDGIKVAFHTSIYGMVFSIMFNFVYKRILDDAETAVREFLAAYKKYVLPDNETEGINRLIELQRQQTEAVTDLSDTIKTEFSRTVRDMLEPHFDRLDYTIESFAKMATKNQMDQLTVVVNAFIAEMNRSVGDSFNKLSETVNSTLEIQRANEKQMHEIYDRSVSTADNVSVIATQTATVAESLKAYVDEVQRLERSTSQSLDVLMKQSERHQKLAEAVPAEVNETFNIINENLQVVEKHFKNTIENINKTLDQVPTVVDYSYRNLENSQDMLMKSIDELKDVMQRIESLYNK